MLEFHMDTHETDAFFEESFQDGLIEEEGEYGVVAYLRERENVRPPKINNRKRPRPPSPAYDLVGFLRNPSSGPHIINNDGAKRSRKIHPTDDDYICACGAIGPYLDEQRGELVCSRCGLVDSSSGYLVPSFERVVSAQANSRGHSNARFNYFKERMSQWACTEPPIPMADRMRLLETYRSAMGTPLQFDPFLPKHEVRRLVITAELASKKYTEKWLSIRILCGADPHPFPTNELIERLEGYFLAVLNTWQSMPSLRQGRSSLPSYDYMICQFLLFISKEVYILYAPWFAQKTECASPQLATCWSAICRRLGWPILCATWTDKGISVTRQSTL